MFLYLFQIYGPHNTRWSHKVVILLFGLKLFPWEVIYTQFDGKSLHSCSRTPCGIAFIFLNVTDKYLSSFDDDYQNLKLFRALSSEYCR